MNMHRFVRAGCACLLAAAAGQARAQCSGLFFNAGDLQTNAFNGSSLAMDDHYVISGAPGKKVNNLLNAGEAEIPWPSSIRVRWGIDTFLAADGLADYRLRKESAREVRLERPGRGSKASLRPGDRRIVAWLRFAAPTEVQVELSR